VRLLAFAAVLVAIAAAAGGDELTADVDESLLAPKMGGLTAFIQEKADGDCAEATSKAYDKFKGDMAKITALKEKADARANKSETEAQKQAGIARRCLAAEQLLSGDAKSRREKLRDHIKKEVSIVEEQYAARNSTLNDVGIQKTGKSVFCAKVR
jgi:hypothetical protein